MPWGLVALLVIVLATGIPRDAGAQDVDIQVHVRFSTTGKPVPVTCDAGGPVGNETGAPFHNCNATVPYVPPRWFCADHASFSAYSGGPGRGDIKNGDVNVHWCHERAGHSYHCLRLPPNPITRSTPMAFPPGEPVSLRIQNRTDAIVVLYAQLTGYLGRAASETRRECACLPAGVSC